MAMSVDSFARRFNIDKKDVLKQLPDRGSRKADGNRLLNHNEIARLKQALNINDEQDVSGDNVTEQPPPQLPEIPTASIEADDAPVQGQIIRGTGLQPLFLHDDVMEQTTNNTKDTHLRSRINHSLQQLMAHGRTSTVKGVKGKNRGWRRAPLGGNGGMQWYLWWAPVSAKPLSGVSLPADAIAVRAVRHHDDTDQLLLGGAREDYQSINPDDLQTSDGTEVFPTLWTDQQREVISRPDGIKIVHGYPGAGKTTALWQTVCQRDKEEVLYLTWSERLSTAASEYFGAFAATSSTIRVMTWRALIALLLPDMAADDRELLFNPKRERFITAFERLPNKLKNGWRDCPEELYGELRAYLIGRVTVSTSTEVVGVATPRLSNEAYLDLRKDDLGQHAAKQALEIAAALDQGGELLRFFPTPARATQASRRLMDQDTAIPEALRSLNRIVVDELQDLTIAEIELISVLTARIAHEREDKRAPFVVVAGDEGQTVRPTGFEWGAAKRALCSQLDATPWETTLEANVRCPKPIAGVVNDLGRHYKQLHKFARPKHMRAVDVHDAVSGRIVVTNVADKNDEVAEVLGEIANDPDVALVTASGEPDPWVSTICGEALLTPEEVKGLDFQSVVVIDAGHTMRQVEQRTHEAEQDGDRVGTLWSRTTLDQLRVAVSRATGTLSFVELADDGWDQLQALISPHDPIDVDPEELATQLIGELSPGERARTAAERALEFLESNPRLAWRRATEGVRTLGEDPALPGAVAEEATRAEVTETLVRVALTLGCGASTEHLNTSDMLREADSRRHDAPKLAPLRPLMKALMKRAARAGAPQPRWYVEAMQATKALAKMAPWIARLVEESRKTWADSFEALLQPGAGRVVEAAQIAAAFYDATGRPDAEGHTQNRLIKLAELLLDTPGQKSKARLVVDELTSPPPSLDGRAWEASGAPEKAIKVYQKAQLWAKQLDCARRHGMEPEAMQAARKIPDAPEAKAAKWAFELKLQLRRQPDTELTEREREAIRLALPLWARARAPKAADRRPGRG